jgi:hypothetical protein
LQPNLEYRSKNKKFYTVAELRYVEGIDDDLYGKIKKYVIVKSSTVDFVKDEFGIIQKIKDSKKGLLSNIYFEMRTRFSNDLQPSRGYLEPGKYLGPRPKFYNRFIARYTQGGYIFTGSACRSIELG